VREHAGSQGRVLVRPDELEVTYRAVSGLEVLGCIPIQTAKLRSKGSQLHGSFPKSTHWQAGTN
jgi:hypothetical protein